MGEMVHATLAIALHYLKHHARTMEGAVEVPSETLLVMLQVLVTTIEGQLTMNVATTMEHVTTTQLKSCVVRAYAIHRMKKITRYSSNVLLLMHTRMFIPLAFKCLHFSSQKICYFSPCGFLFSSHIEHF